MLLSSNHWIALVILLASNLTLVIYQIKLRQAVKQLPRIDLANASQNSCLDLIPKISVIVPAFNEEENIKDCIQSILANTQLSVEQLEVWVIDDRSTDRTPEILKDLQGQLADPRLNILFGLPKPDDQIWVVLKRKG